MKSDYEWVVEVPDKTVSVGVGTAGGGTWRQPGKELTYHAISIQILDNGTLLLRGLAERQMSSDSVVAAFAHGEWISCKRPDYLKEHHSVDNS